MMKNPLHTEPTIEDELDGRLLTIQEAARLCKVSQRTIYNWMEHHKMPYFEIGRIRRVPLVDLREWTTTKTRVNRLH